MADIERRCGTCRRWDESKQASRPASLPRPGHGECRLDGKERQASDMAGCLGWKEADPWVIDAREIDGII